MPTYYLAPDPCQSTFFIPGGNQPGNGVKVFTYATGTTTKVSVAKDAAGAALHTNPIILDSGGNLPSASSMYIEAGVTIDVVYAPSGDSDPPTSAYKTVSTVRGVPPQNTSTSQWVSVASPVFVNTNAFRVEGDQTTELHVGRRIRTTNTGGIVYSRVTSTAFGTSTTVGVINDSGAIDSGISTAAYGLLSSDNNSVPLLTDFYPTLRSSTAIHTQSQNIQAYTSSHTVTWPDKDGTVAMTADLNLASTATSSWTPSLQGGTPSYNTQTGKYRVIGGTCIFSFYIALSASTGTAPTVTGLPVQVLDYGSYRQGGAKIGWDSVAITTYNVETQFSNGSGSTQIALIPTTSATVTSNHLGTGGWITNSTIIWGAGSFPTQT